MVWFALQVSKALTQWDRADTGGVKPELVAEGWRHGATVLLIISAPVLAIISFFGYV
jgi:hypothetical protein